MTSGQKAGVVLTVVVDALWSVVVIAILATPPDAGANIGAGVLGLLALPLSIVAAAVLITTADSTAPRAAGAAPLSLWALYVAPSRAHVGLAAVVAPLTRRAPRGPAPRPQPPPANTPPPRAPPDHGLPTRSRVFLKPPSRRAGPLPHRGPRTARRTDGRAEP